MGKGRGSLQWKVKPDSITRAPFLKKQVAAVLPMEASFPLVK